MIPLGELCRVHRGQATGANQFWIVDGECTLPESVLHRTVTRARELLTAGPILEATSPLKRVVDLPADLAGFERAERREIECFLQRGRAAGINQGYLAAHRRVWWSIRLRSPAPILATYMARRSPVFVVNVAEARHLNIAHGLYPREPLSQNLLRKLAKYLTTSVTQAEGRTYAGGLTKFEPREMERLLVPRPELLNEMFKDEL